MTDTERLDFLAACSCFVRAHDEGFSVWQDDPRGGCNANPVMGFPVQTFPEMREAVDAAIDYSKGRVIKTYEALQRFADAANPKGY